MDTISTSCEMNDSQGGSFVTDFYHFDICFLFFFSKIIIKNLSLQ